MDGRTSRPRPGVAGHWSPLHDHGSGGRVAPV